MIAYGFGLGVTSDDFIQKVIAPTDELKSAAGATVIWLGTVPSKLMTPVRVPSVAAQAAEVFAPGWPPAGLVSAITPPTGAASKLKRKTNEASMTSATRRFEAQRQSKHLRKEYK